MGYVNVLSYVNEDSLSRKAGDTPQNQIEAQLERILGSERFLRADRAKRLLAFLVQKALGGDSGSVTEYVLAMEVFGRKQAFDPAADPIVRVETGRLRRRLQEYYEGEGLRDPILIEVPPRSYAPAFRSREAAAPAPAKEAGSRAATKQRWMRIGAAAVVLCAALFIGAAVWARARGAAVSSGAAGRRVSIAVLPFSDLSNGGGQDVFCEALTRAITGAVTRVEGLNVVSHAWVVQYRGRTADVRSAAAQLNAGLILAGSVQRVGDRVRVTAELTNASNGFNVWSQTYDREMADTLGVQQELAHAVVDAVRPEIARMR